MRKKMVMILMMTIITLALAGCGKKAEETKNTAEPTKETAAEVAPSETTEVKEPVESTESDDIYDPIGDGEVEDDGLFGQFVMDAMMEYTVGAEGDMVVTASEKVGVPLEDIIPGGFSVLFPMNPYYQGQTEQDNASTTFSATNGDYTYKITVAITNGKFNPKGEDRGDIFYENTDFYAMEAAKTIPFLSEDGNNIQYGAALARIYSSEADATIEIRMDVAGNKEDENTWVKTEWFNQWVDANIETLKEKYEALKQ